MLEQGIMVMITGMATVFIFLVILALLMVLSSKIIIRFSPPPLPESSSHSHDLIAVIATAIHQKIKNK